MPIGERQNNNAIVYNFLASFGQSDVADRRTEPFSTKYVPIYCITYTYICMWKIQP